MPTQRTTSSAFPSAIACPALRVTLPVGGRTWGRARQTGFNFTEVLFAVMILGIGFIMVAAIFPVALHQTKLTGEEVQASTTARGGVNLAQQIGLDAGALYGTVLTAPDRMIEPGDFLVVEGMVSSFRDVRIPDPDYDPGPPVVNGPLTPEDARDWLWRQISGNLILPSDNRAGMIVFYRRGMTFYNPETSSAALPHSHPDVQKTLHPYAQVWVVGVQARNRSAFELTEDARRWPDDGPGAAASTTHASLEGKLIRVKLYEGDTRPDRISLHEYDTGNLVDEPSAAEGAYIIISDDEFPIGVDADPTTTVAEVNGQSNGRVYRLGARLDEGVWELSPGEDMMLILGPDQTAGTADDIHENIPARPVNPTETVPVGGVAAPAFIIGRGYTDPTDPAAGYEGTSQATGVYTSFIPAN